ncbi:MAG TPA: hypothetical protein VIK91_09585, partial [Nannocystis sp.]
MSTDIARIRAVEATLAFTRREDVAPDAERPGLLRARTLDFEAMSDPGSFDRRVCRVHDCSDGFVPELLEHGFAHADLSRARRLQAVLERVRRAGRLDDESAAEIRRRLTGAVLRLSGGARLWVLYLAREGFFMRRAGPAGVPLVRASGGMNDHDAAVSVHADQDVHGTPVRQILRGAAPWLFRHESPDGCNARSRLLLVNVWIPLEQVTRPLALMDRRSIDRRAHQLRYGMPTDRFLRREAALRINDVWTFLHDPEQRWYFTSEIDARTAYVFETLSTPHASFMLPGEQRAAERYRRLTAAIAAVRDSDAEALGRVLAEGDGGDVGPEPATAPLQR